MVNTDPPYPHFLHILDPKSLVSVETTGELEVSFAGIVEAGVVKARIIQTFYAMLQIWCHLLCFLFHTI